MLTITLTWTRTPVWLWYNSIQPKNLLTFIVLRAIIEVPDWSIQHLIIAKSCDFYYLNNEAIIWTGIAWKKPFFIYTAQLTGSALSKMLKYLDVSLNFFELSHLWKSCRNLIDLCKYFLGMAQSYFLSKKTK